MEEGEKESGDYRGRGACDEERQRDVLVEEDELWLLVHFKPVSVTLSCDCLC